MKLKEHLKKFKMKEFLLFGAVGGFGVVVNTLVLYVLTFNFGLYYIISSIIATEIAILSNFFGNNFLTFKNQGHSSLFKKFANFQVISLITVFLTVFLLWSMTSLFGIRLLIVWNIIAIGITFLLNFLLNIKFTWKNKK